jgi:hypothetical protein
VIRRSHLIEDAEVSSPVNAPAAETWLREALERLWQELRLFVRTGAAFISRPARFARDWQTGELTVMNPLAFGATAAGVYWAVTNVLALVWPIPTTQTPDSLATEITSALGPYLHYGLLGATMHLALRALGSRRRILGSIGIAFFAGGSIGTLGALLLSAVARWFAFVRGTSSLELRTNDVVPLLIFTGAVLSYALVCVMMARALKALHHTAGWKTVAAVIFAVVVTALLFGNLIPDGNFGWRPYIRAVRDDGWGFSFGFRG